MNRIALIVFWYCLSANAQNNLQIHIFRSGTNSADSVTDIHFKKFRFYLSSFQFYHQGKPLELSEQNYLINADSANLVQLNLSVPKDKAFDSISFMIGIDSAKLEQGIQGGALDPLHGMYWTWQSGYINIKMEGAYKYQNTIQHFQWHIGGYRWPYQSALTLGCRANPNTNINLEIDLFQFAIASLKRVSNNVMSPGKMAHQLSQNFSKCIRIQSASK